ncbi:NACHT domain-containing protein [Actinoplanes sp. NPDC051411]|uniref:NACHT domain-containing protein n=1 Tax=Actinoplanes sp. NPDC051411 TaxID=3155522 RepID=UPI003441ABE9
MGRAWKVVLGLLAIVLAPAVATWQGIVTKRPVVALLFAATWLVVAGVAALVWRLLGAPVSEALDTRGRSLWAAAERRFSPYARSYRDWILQSHSSMPRRGLNTFGPFSPELDDVFVDLALTPRSPGQVPTGVVSRADAHDTRRRQIWEFLGRRDPAILVVLGPPGSGKTTLLSHVARRITKTYAHRERPVPVLLQFREQAPKIAADPSAGLAAVIRASVPAQVGTEPAGWWESRLRAGKCIVLLDGLDEVAGDEERRAVMTWVDAQISLHPGNEFVVTSRPHGYRNGFDRATTVQVLPFTPEQVATFVRGWFREAELRESEDPAGAEDRATAAADHLLRQTATVPGLHDLRVNPLLLTMIANVHRYGRGRLPDSRADLYREVCDVMLWQRDEDKGRRLDPPGPRRLAVLSLLAFDWMRTRRQDFSRRQLLDTLRPWLGASAPERFVADMKDAGLLQETRQDEYAFVHQTFQEYLAARCVADTDRWTFLAEVVDDPWWRETTVLYAADNDADPIVLAALRKGTENALSLAFEIAGSGGRVSPAVLARLNDFLDLALRPEAGAVARRVAADVLIGRQLRGMTVTTDGRRVASTSVPDALYQLFLSATGTPAPDGWNLGGAEAAARGMWSGDAVKFVAWVNALVAATPRGSGGLTFRLPEAAELDELEAAGLGPGGPAWAAGGRAPRVWWPNGRAATLQADRAAEAIGADLHGSVLFTGVFEQLTEALAGTIKSTSRKMSRTSATRSTGVQLRAGARMVDDPVEAARIADLRRTVAIHLNEARVLLRTLDSLIAVVRLMTERAGAARRAAAALDRAERTVRNDIHGDRELDLLLKAIKDRVEQVRALLGSKPETAGMDSPVDRTLASIGPDLALPEVHDPGVDPAAAVVRSLLPGRIDHMRINLYGLAARVARLPRAGTAQQGVLEAIATAAIPVLTREAPLTAPVAASIRVPALVAAQLVGDPRLAADLVELALGVYLMQLRARSPRTLEALVLACD